MIGISELKSFQAATSMGKPAEGSNLRPSRLLSLLVSGVVVLSVIWPKSIFFGVDSLPSVNPYTLIVMLFDCAIFAQFFFSFKVRTRLVCVFSAAKLITASFLLWYLWRLIADLVGETPLGSLLITLRDLVYLGSLFVIAALVTADHLGRRFIVRALLLSTLIASLAGIYENLSNQFITEALGLVNLAINQTRLDLLLNTVNSGSFRDGALRAKSFFTHPIIFAQFLGCMIPLAWHAIRFESSRVFRFLGFGVISLIPWAIFATGTRSGFITAGGGVYMLVLMASMKGLGRNPLKSIAMFFAFVIPVVILIIAWDDVMLLVQGRSEREVNSSIDRIIMLKQTLAALGDSPIYGFGDGNDLIKAGIVYADNLLTMDNLYLSIVLDFGLVGLLLFLLLAGALLWRGFLLNLSTASPENSSLARALTAGAATILVGQTILSIKDNMSVIYLYSAIVCGLCASGTRPSFGVRLRPVLRRHVLRGAKPGSSIK